MLTILFFIYLIGVVRILWTTAAMIVRGDRRLDTSFGRFVAFLFAMFWPVMIFVLSYDEVKRRRANVRTRRAM